MKIWPVTDSCYKKLPKTGASGSFWEDRKDRYHCGIDIYAPADSDVLSVEDGQIIDIGKFTSPKKVSYWNATYYILIKSKSEFFCKYAELADVSIKIDKYVKAGQLIGHVGQVLNKDKITKKSPSYIRKISKKSNYSMLHFELYKNNPIKSKKYLGGNWFNKNKPDNLLDPLEYLKSTIK